MKKRILSLFLITVMILSTFAIIPVSATENTFNANDAVPVITTLEDLNAFDEAIEGGNFFSGKTVKLAADIDLPSDFTGIGIDQDGAKGFGGIFDGQGHTITMSGHSTASGWKGQLFTFTENGGNSATIKDLNVDGTMTMATRDNNSVLLGRPLTKEVIIENVHISVDITTSGLVDTMGVFIYGLRSGTEYSNVTIKGCVYDGTINAQNGAKWFGGFIGDVTGGEAKNVTIQDCVYAGTMNFFDNEATEFPAGFIGDVKENDDTYVTIKDCYSIGTMNFAGTTKPSGTCEGGTVIGRLTKNNNVSIKNLYYVNVENLNGEGNMPVVGRNADSAATITTTNVVAKTKAEIAALTTGAFSNDSTMTFKTVKVDNVNLYYPAPAGLVKNGWLSSLSVVSGNATVLGAQIRCTGEDDDYSGIRFVSVFNKSAVTGAQTANANFGIILIAKSKLDTMQGDVTIANLKAAGGIDIQATNATEVGDYYRVNAVVYEIDDDYYKNEIVAYTYIGDALVGESVTRSIYEVAELCLDDTNATEAQRNFCATIVPQN